MKASTPVQPKHTPLLGLFLSGYEPMRLKMDEKCQPSLLEMAPLMFGKWYYTTLAAETILTPANLIQQDLEKEWHTTDTEYAYLLRADRKAEAAQRYSLSLFSYSAAEHPLIEDLKALIAFCHPDRQINEQGLFLREETAPLLDCLSLQDDFYLEYLTRLAWMQGLLIPLPSIHTKKIQPSPECDAFFAEETAVILKELGETACELAAERFRYSMDLDEGIATAAFFRGCLNSHLEVDRIFIDFYLRVDVKIDEIWRKAPETLTAEDESILSSFLFTGIMLDKWFLTPMGLFFHFIRPIAFSPISFFHLVNHLASLLLIKHNPGAELFNPAAYYSLTALGASLFAIPGEEGLNRQKMPDALDYEDVAETMLQQADLHAREHKELLTVPPKIFSIKVSLLRDKSLWRIIDVYRGCNVHEFCCDLCMVFGTEGQVDYLLTVPDANGFPLEYSAIDSKRSVNKGERHELRDLPLSLGSRMTLSPFPGEGSGLLLEIMEIGEGNPFLMYPRIREQSEAVSRLEQADELF